MDAPIGVFDSGLGGLTVVREILALLPKEDVLYFGDIARLPYGTKSKDVVLRFSIENSLFLLSRKVKLLVIACNTASAVALEFLKSILSVPVLGVIDPAIEELTRQGLPDRVAVIGTNATIRSGVYQRKLREVGIEDVFAKPCPLLVPMIESGYLRGEICDQIIRYEVGPVLKKGVRVLLLGCTHYPIIKGKIRRLFPKVKVVDSALPTARAVKKTLEAFGLERKRGKGRLEVFVSDVPEDFEVMAKRFLGRSEFKVTTRKVGDVLH